jgi:hypothetical protein
MLLLVRGQQLGAAEAVQIELGDVDGVPGRNSFLRCGVFIRNSQVKGSQRCGFGEVVEVSQNSTVGTADGL